MKKRCERIILFDFSDRFDYLESQGFQDRSENDEGALEREDC